MLEAEVRKMIFAASGIVQCASAAERKVGVSDNDVRSDNALKRERRQRSVVGRMGEDDGKKLYVLFNLAEDQPAAPKEPAHERSPTFCTPLRSWSSVQPRQPLPHRASQPPPRFSPTPDIQTKQDRKLTIRGNATRDVRIPALFINVKKSKT